MDVNLSRSKKVAPIDVESVVSIIVDAQYENGEIPWFRGEKTDPWDHVESAIGLCIGGHLDRSQKAFEWLTDTQLEDGSWYAAYKNGIPVDKTRETNLSAYVAVGVYYYYLATHDRVFLKKMWPTVKAAIDFAISLQTDTGEIYWAISPDGEIDRMALLTGSSSIYMSLKTALCIASELGYRLDHWKKALYGLGDAILKHPHLFNVTKARFSMDWFYPILSGALTGQHAQKRLDKYWKKFVVKGLGIRCVSDEPWVTLAETSEFVLALFAMGNLELAKIVFNWIQDKRFEDGSYWCGFTFPEMITWPEDKITWTNAVILMAADALYELTPACRMFSHEFWNMKTELV